MESQQGYVYILTNPSFKDDWVKIGKSSRPVDIRSKELDNTAVPLPFEIYATLKTKKFHEAEKLVHRYIERFTNLRIRDNREFFNVKPEEALEIFRDVALLLDDAEIDEVHKKVSMADGINPKQMPITTREQGESKVWLIPSNSKYFNLQGCFKKYGQVYWKQYYSFQKGDTGYIYMTSPNSSIEYSFEVVAHDLRYSPDMEKEKDFFSDIKDFEKYKEYNRFSLLKITGNTKSNRLSLMNLMDNGIKGAPQGALILSHNSYKELLEYIRSNFDK